MEHDHSDGFRGRYGPWAVVTGASSGIGRVCALELVSRGLNVVLVARRGSELEALATEITVGAGNEARVVAAAGFGASGVFLERDPTEDLSMLNLNCAAVLVQSRHFGERFVRRGRGGLVLFGSLVGFQGAPNAANYAGTKAYVQTLAEGLHVELAPRGVDVLVSAPG